MGGDAARSRRSFSPSRPTRSCRSFRRRSATIAYPLATKNYHHEIELVVAIGARGVRVAPERAEALIYGYAVGLDMTRRDLQSAMREIKRPWDIGKSFAQAAPIGPIHPVAEVGHPKRGRICARGQRRGPAAGRSRRHDLGRAAHAAFPVAILRAAARRPDLHRHARRRRRGRRRRHAGRPHRSRWASSRCASARLPRTDERALGRLRRARIQPAQRLSRSSAVVRALGRRQRASRDAPRCAARTCATAADRSRRSTCSRRERRAARCCSSTAATGARSTRTTIRSSRPRWSSAGIGVAVVNYDLCPAVSIRAHRRGMPRRPSRGCGAKARATACRSSG